MEDKKTPFKLILITFSNILVSNLWEGVTSCSIPALLNTVSIVLKFLIMYLYNNFTSFSLLTSAWKKYVFKPFSSSSFWVWRPFFLSTSQNITVAPCCAKVSTVALPIPVAPPVTKEILFFKIVILS